MTKYASTTALKRFWTKVKALVPTIDSALSSTSTNPVQNKVINTALAGKQAKLTAGTNITLSGSTISASQPTVNNGTLTIKQNGTQLGTFTANQSGSTTVDIPLLANKLDVTELSATSYTVTLTTTSATNGTIIPCYNKGAAQLLYSVGGKYYPANSQASSIWSAYIGRIYSYNTEYYIVTSSGLMRKISDTTYSAATTSAAGLMSASDKTKLDGLSTSGYTLPEATASTLGGVKLYNPSSAFSGVPSISSSGVMEVGKYLDFHHKTGSIDYYTRLYCSSSSYVELELPSENGVLAIEEECDNETYDGDFEVLVTKRTNMLHLNSNTTDAAVGCKLIVESYLRGHSIVIFNNSTNTTLTLFIITPDSDVCQFRFRNSANVYTGYGATAVKSSLQLKPYGMMHLSFVGSTVQSGYCDGLVI